LLFVKHFFGIVRQACGSNQHPDPKQFVQIYRLLSCYSLIKPPRGSNVDGGEVIKTLLDIQINNSEDIQKKADLFCWLCCTKCKKTFISKKLHSLL